MITIITLSEENPFWKEKVSLKIIGGGGFS
jgi:hypothetical protein